MSFVVPSTGIASFSDIFRNRQEGTMTVVKKFGRGTVGTSMSPVAIGGDYLTPQVSGATKLRVKAGDANDAPGGSGARSIVIEGIDETGAFASETIATNGASAGPNSVNDYIRLFRFYVAESGTYGTSSAGSHAADIVIENAAGTADWGTIDATGFPRGQSEIGAYTVPLGYQAYVSDLSFTSDASKTVIAEFFQRQGILDSSPPYKAMREFGQITSINNSAQIVEPLFYGPFPECTDLGVLARVSATTATISVRFTILLIEL